MLKKIAGWCMGLLSLGCAMFFTIALSDVIIGNPKTPFGVSLGLVVFFGGLTLATGTGALRLLRARKAPQTTAPAPPVEGGIPIDISLEAQILKLAAAHDGKVTPAEVALACGVSLDAASAALDGLVARGHADLHVTSDGEAVHVLKGIVTRAEKAASQDVLAYDTARR